MELVDACKRLALLFFEKREQSERLKGQTDRGVSVVEVGEYIKCAGLLCVSHTHKTHSLSHTLSLSLFLSLPLSKGSD